MPIEVKIDDNARLLREELSEFYSSVENAGCVVNIESLPPAKVKLAGPTSYIEIGIDPETLLLIFEYVTALVLTYKATDYFGEFLKGVTHKFGEMTGAKLAGAISKLWHRFYDRTKNHQDINVDLALNSEIEGASIRIINSIYSHHSRKISNQDIEPVNPVLS